LAYRRLVYGPVHDFVLCFSHVAPWDNQRSLDSVSSVCDFVGCSSFSAYLTSDQFFGKREELVMSVVEKKIVLDEVRAALQRSMGANLPSFASETFEGRVTDNKSAVNDWSLDVEATFVTTLERWAKAKALHQSVDSVLDAAKAEVVDAVMPIFAEKLYKDRQKPSNPTIELIVGSDVKHRYQIWMTNVFTTHFSKRTMDDHVTDGFVEELMRSGLPLTQARDLVDNELRLIRVRGIRQLNELMSGSFGKQGDWLDSSEVEKRAAEKFEAWLRWDGSSLAPEPLTDVEKQAALIFKNAVEVRPGFLDRIHKYVRSPQEILAIFNLITPSIFPTRLEFGLGEDENAKAMRKLEFSLDILS